MAVCELEAGNVSPVALNVSWRGELEARTVSPRLTLCASWRTDSVELLQVATGNLRLKRPFQVAGSDKNPMVDRQDGVR